MIPWAMPRPRSAGRTYMRLSSPQPSFSTTAPQPAASPSPVRATANSTCGRISAAISMPWWLSGGYSGFW